MTMVDVLIDKALNCRLVRHETCSPLNHALELLSVQSCLHARMASFNFEEAIDKKVLKQPDDSPSPNKRYHA